MAHPPIICLIQTTRSIELFPKNNRACIIMLLHLYHYYSSMNTVRSRKKFSILVQELIDYIFRQDAKGNHYPNINFLSKPDDFNLHKYSIDEIEKQRIRLFVRVLQKKKRRRKKRRGSISIEAFSASRSIGRVARCVYFSG